MQAGFSFSHGLPLYLSTQNMLGGQQDGGCRVVYHVQREHHQSYLWHHYQNQSIQDRHIYSVQDGTKFRSFIFQVNKDRWNSPTLLLSQSVSSA